MSLVKEKIRQAHSILKELDWDCWLVFVRETEMMADPIMPLVVGHNVTWQSFFIFTSKGDAIALVGLGDRDNFVRSGDFTRVIPYTQGVKEDFLRLMAKIDPQKIAVNYSIDDVAADGLTFGMYQMLCGFIEGTPQATRLVSAESLISKLRSRKLPSEVALLEEAAKISERIWEKTVAFVKAGMSEKEIGNFIDRQINAAGYVNSFPTIVNAGAKTEPGHGAPTEAVIEPGELLHVDFGLKYQGYCSDIQRLLYLRKKGKSAIPKELERAFNLVRDIITKTAKMCRPGVPGYEIDSHARAMLIKNGYPEYEHALGHQLGRSVHDGGGIIGPRWERYGLTPSVPLELSNVSTLELEINLPHVGCVALEEDVVVESNGARFLSERQMELVRK